MVLTLADFDPIVEVLSDNLPIIVGLVVTIAGLNAVITLVRRFAHV